MSALSPMGSIPSTVPSMSIAAIREQHRAEQIAAIIAEAREAGCDTEAKIVGYLAQTVADLRGAK